MVIRQYPSITMEAKLTTTVAILTALLITHHPSLTSAATIADHTTTPANDASLDGGFSLQLVEPDLDDLDHIVRRGSNGFLHLQSLRADVTGATSSSAANGTALRPKTTTYAPLRIPRALVINVGTGPAKQDYLFKVVDDAGTIIWMQCHGCDPHSPQRHPLFDSRYSLTYRLVAGDDPFCRPPYWSILQGHACAFRVDGPRGMSIEGHFGTDQLTYNNAVHQNVPFGCATKAHNFQNDGMFAGVIGATAVARGLTRFSYCLFHGGDTNRQRRGFLRFGTDVPRNPRYRTTRIIHAEPSGGHHYVSLVGVSVGARRLDAIRPEMFARREDGQGGCVIDLGTAATVMARAAYDVVEEAVWSDLERHGAERVARREYGLCVRAPEAIRGRLRPLSLHFSGSGDGEEEAVLVVSPQQLFVMMDDERQGRIACLAVTPGRRTVVGALQQVDTRFVFDLKDSKLSFAPESCIRDTVEVVV